MNKFKTTIMVVAMIFGVLFTGVNAEAATTGHLYRSNDYKYCKENATTFRGVIFDYYGNRMEVCNLPADKNIDDLCSEDVVKVMQMVYDIYKMVDDELTRNGGIDYVVYMNEYYDDKLTRVDWQSAISIRNDTIEMEQDLNVTDYLTIR